MTVARAGALLLAALVRAVPAGAQQAAAPDPSRTLTIPRVDTPPRLEDYLDGVPRPDEARITNFVQREPGDGVPASQPTEAYISYDDRQLFVLFVARGAQPGQIRATLAKRENFGNDDFVGIVSWQLNPWTALYVGYTDGYANLEIDPVDRPPAAHRFTIPLGWAAGVREVQLSAAALRKSYQLSAISYEQPMADSRQPIALYFVAVVWAAPLRYLSYHAR